MAADVHRNLRLQRQNSAAIFEQEHVQHVYNEIASSVDDIQHRAWPNVKRFLKKLDQGALVADIGCGNGRYLGINSNTCKIGVDVCQQLVNSARSKGHEVAYADNLCLPFRSNMFDAVISIGVVHHFCSPDRRVKAIEELTRIMRPGGKLMLYVWAYEQKHRKFDSQDVLVPWHEGKSLSRTDSTASCQSSSGFSSTSSFSEDELPDQIPPEALSKNRSLSRGRSMSSERSMSKERPLYKERSTSEERSLSKVRSISEARSISKERLFSIDKLRKQSGQFSRQSSVSLEDINMLSNFNSNYYALDFSPKSPKRNQRLSDTKDKSQNEKSSLVSECRKIEASLRALSSGCLIEKDLQGQRNDLDPSIYGTDGNLDNKLKCQHGSLENLKNSTKVARLSIRSDKLKRNSPLSSSNESLNSVPIQVSGKSSGKMSPLFLNSFKDTENVNRSINRIMSSDDLLLNRSPESGSPTDFYLDDDDEVFFALGDTVATNEQKRTPTKGSLSESKPGVANSDSVYNAFDQVDVQFKPDRPDILQKLRNKQKAKESKENEKSVFGFLKSKVLQIFNSDSVNGAKIEKTNMINSKTVPEVNNCTKETTIPPELPYDLLTMAKKLNFKVREFPLSSCAELPKDFELALSPKSPKFQLKFDIGGDNSENQITSPQKFKQYSCRQESIEQDGKPLGSGRKLERGESFEKNPKSSRSDRRLDRKISSGQLKRTNSGNNLLKSAVLNRTKRNSPTTEQCRSNPFIVRSFSSDYVEDPSTSYPFKNMKANGIEEINIESPKEVLSIEQTLYDCFIKIDVDKINSHSGKVGHTTMQNRDKRESLDSEISIESIELDDKWEFGETLYHDEGINMVVNDATDVNGFNEDHKQEHRGNGVINGKVNNEQEDKNSVLEEGYSSGYREKMLDEIATENVLNGDLISEYNNVKSMYNGSEKTRESGTFHEGVNLKDRKRVKEKSSINECNANELTSREDKAGTNLFNKGISEANRPSQIPDVSCVGKATEGPISTKLCRYYHVFREGELEKLISSHIKNLHVVQCFYDHANWCLVAVKKDDNSYA